jgi:cysteine-rich repeat protein
VIVLLGGTGAGGSAGAVDPCQGPNPPPECGTLVPSGPGCGDGQINQETEACDDGNPLPGDGCNGVCVVEPNFVCPEVGQPCVSTIVCGDGVLSGAEVCDDGNTAGGDGCTAACDGIELGYVCPVPGEPCTTAATDCGDGIRQTGEQCDDGTNDGGYGQCASGCVLGPHCGGGEVQTPYEDCDDQLNAGGYGQCAPGCILGPHCGDGILQPGYEECDDGNSVDQDGCSRACKDEILVVD